MQAAENSPLARAAARYELTLRRARKDFPAFFEYVFGLTPAAHHQKWMAAAGAGVRTVVLAPIEHGKSTVFSVGFPLWVLGKNPNARIAIVSETHAQAVRPLGAIREHIVKNERLHEVFPGLRPASGAREKWTDSEILVERTLVEKDPSVIAIGVLGPLLGARLDLAILDDVVGWENSFTPAQRSKLVDWFRSTLVGRIVAGGRVVAVGTPWHPEDLLHVLAGSGEYQLLRDPALDDDGKPLWPEAWSVERLEQRRREIGEVEFSRQMLLRPVSDATSRFKADWIERAFQSARDMGVVLVDSYSGPCRSFSGVDLGVGEGTQHGESAIFTIALLPDGRRQVLSIEAGRWQAPELLERLKATSQRFGSRLRVESNAAQMYLVQFLREAGVGVDAHNTGRNKHDPQFGIESLAVEMERGLWIVPDAPATRTWVRELLAYNPAGHTGDRVMASWLAREAARTAEAAPPFPVPFLTSLAPMQFPVGENVITSRPGGLPEEMWQSRDGGMWPQW
jgi:hypothetical protein